MGRVKAKKQNEDEKFVYFIFSSDDMFVKVGITTDLSKRLSSIQNGCPTPLRLGGYVKFDNVKEATKYERMIIDKFGDINAHGEWFKHTPEISQWIRDNSLPISIEGVGGSNRSGRKSLSPLGTVIRDHFSYRPEMREKVLRLRNKRLLSKACCQGIENYIEDE